MKSRVMPYVRAMQCLADDGVPVAEVARRFGFPQATVAPFVRSKRRRVFRPDVCAGDVAKLVATGATVSQAANTFGCSRWLIYLRLGTSRNRSRRGL